MQTFFVFYIFALNRIPTSPIYKLFLLIIKQGPPDIPFKAPATVSIVSLRTQYSPLNITFLFLINSSEILSLINS